MGRNLESKALFLALDVMRKLGNRNVSLTVVGVGEDGAYSMDVPDNVRFVGQVSHDKALDLIASCDATLFTSLFEATPHVVLESLYLGDPVICHDAWGHGDVIDGTCGIKIPFVSPAISTRGFVEAICRLMDDRVLLEGLRDGAYKVARSLSWERRAKQVVKIYAEVTGTSDEISNAHASETIGVERTG